GTIGLEKSTTENYTKLLEAVFLIHRLPAWGTTLGARITRHPKVHLVDSGVMAWLLNLTPQKIGQAAPATLSEYGHFLETFAVGEILKTGELVRCTSHRRPFPHRGRRRGRPRA
ncbi:MAG TPA: DUF4143 domain-containing protein, partial [Streptosporangiaceae bacterium]|nr:DUF4143 domain-containing protein [Streptosporangiaceae bacterium]